MSNVIQGQFGATSPLDQQTIIQGIAAKQAAGESVNTFTLLRSLDLDSDLDQVRDYLIRCGVCTKKEWQQGIRNALIAKRLGCVPKTAVELVDVWVRLEDLRVDFQKRMHSNKPPMFDGIPMTAESRKDPDVDAIARIIESAEVNTETVKRDLRLLTDELKMGFKERSIEDAVSVWFETHVDGRVQEIYGDIRCKKGGLRVDAVADAWQRVTCQFDLTDHDAAFVEAILRKFIWQVKRKMLGMPVTNHLMPVLLGSQGVGKSTFVKEVLTKPVAELMSSTDFNMVTDERNKDLWRNFVLFMDEMGFAGKADIDKVKGRITESSITIRPMRTNDTIQVRQCATFIGCSNKELDQLIRDETGNRRFAALRFSNKPDWSLLEGLDPLLLWNSVDERGEDPSKGIAAVLRERQEVVRERSQVEQWLDGYEAPNKTAGAKMAAPDLYKDYSLWAQTYYPNRVMDLSVWGKEFTRLINSGQITNWGKRASNGRNYYVQVV